MKCRICHSTDLTMFLSLGHQPPSDAFLTADQLNEPEVTYPLDVYICEKCKLVQLGYVVPADILYNSEYPYETGKNKHGVAHFKDFAKDTCQRYGLTKESLVVDVGSNDGTLLKGFKDSGCQTFGFEPVCSLAEKARKKGINTAIVNFRPNHEYLSYQGTDIITATNVFAHVDDLHEFMRAVDLLLAPDGTFIIEAPYLLNLIDNVEYDTIYSEHLSYLCHEPLSHLFAEYGMEIVDGDPVPIHGGSYRYHVQRVTGDPLQYESDLNPDRLSDFAEQVQLNARQLIDMLASLKHQGKRIVGVSAPAKGNTLLNYCGIGTEILDYVTDVSEGKVGRFTPGQHIEVKTDQVIIDEQPDYCLLLAWNWKEAIIEKLRQMGYKNNFIIPIPEPKIL